MPTTSAHISMQIKVICPPERNHSMWIGQASPLHPRWHKRAQGRHVDVLQDIPLRVEGARAFALWLPGATSSMFVYGEPAGRVILVRAALLRKPHGCHARTFQMMEVSRNTGRWSRLLRQEFQAQETAKQGTVACERVASPSEAMMQASVVAGIMACRDELSFFMVVEGFEHHELR